MYETLLVGTDGSESAQRAIEHAVELAQAVGATLHVLTVVDVDMNPMSFGVGEVDELNQAKERLIEDITNASDTGDLTADIRRGNVVDSLLEYAAEIDADLLLVGQSDVGKLEAAIVGRKTEQLTNQSTGGKGRVPRGLTPRVKAVS